MLPDSPEKPANHRSSVGEPSSPKFHVGTRHESSLFGISSCRSNSFCFIYSHIQNLLLLNLK
ncbi:hypothetical protein HanIR_Chr09g0422701 [Helianthus annuus]|nr:hypothetical protein HanIR_Chr09g0422701 [Helianthus annuus]